MEVRHGDVRDDNMVVAVTAHGGEFMKEHQDRGFVRQLLKPLDPSELCAAVREAKEHGNAG
jgi:hypothetical protein